MRSTIVAFPLELRLACSNCGIDWTDEATTAVREALESWHKQCRCGSALNLIRGERSHGVRWTPLGFDLLARRVSSPSGPRRQHADAHQA